MFESKAECITGALEITNGTAAFKRDFGLQSVDSNNANAIKRNILRLLAKYYPSISLKSVNIEVSADGQFKFDITTRG